MGQHINSKHKASAHQPTRPFKLPTLSGIENNYQPKFGDTLQLGSQGSMALVDKRLGSQVKLCDSINICHTQAS